MTLKTVVPKFHMTCSSRWCTTTLGLILKGSVQKIMTVSMDLNPHCLWVWKILNILHNIAAHNNAPLCMCIFGCKRFRRYCSDPSLTWTKLIAVVVMNSSFVTNLSDLLKVLPELCTLLQRIFNVKWAVCLTEGEGSKPEDFEKNPNHQL